MFKWYLNMKIAPKLIIGFIIVAIIAGCVGIIGITNILSIGNADTRLFEKNTRSIEYLNGAEEDYLRIRLIIAKSLLTADKPQDDNIKSISDSADQFKANLKLYEGCILNADDQQLFDTISPAWDKYIGQVDKVFELVQNKKIDDAKTLAFGEMQTAANDLQSILDDLLVSVIDDAQLTSDGNRQIVQTAIIMMICIVAAGVIVAIVLGAVISRIISMPVNMMAKDAEKLALGNVNIQSESAELRKDEIGILGLAFIKMAEGARQQAAIAKKIAEGDLTVNVDVRSDNDELGKSLQELVERLNQLVESIVLTAEQVASGSDSVSNSSVALSQGATEQASSVQELTASLEEILSQTNQNAQNAVEANNLTKQAEANAVSGNTQMKEMLAAMEEINVSSGNINKIIKVIDDIAFQTNILALNAAVEAARAGQHGKGFAVVAEEVRNLAARSANAVKETTEMIESSIVKVAAGTKIANNTADALHKIVGQSKEAADLVRTIADASKEQAAGVAQISQGIAQISQVVQTNAATSEEAAAASEELSSQAAQLNETIGIFKLKRNIGIPGDVPRLKTAELRNNDPLHISKARLSLNTGGYGKY
jgi:methyl-accepting chemotaxis protein